MGVPTLKNFPTVPARTRVDQKRAKTLLQAADPMTNKPRPENTPHPDEVNPEEGTAPDDTPVENPSG